MDRAETATAKALADRTRFRYYRKTALTLARQMDVPFSVETSDGVVDGVAGDYLCLYTSGRPYCCRKADFEAAYVEAPDDGA